MGACKILLLDVMTPEVHRNDRNNVHELSGPIFNFLHKNLVWWAVTQLIWKSHKIGCGGGGALAQIGNCMGVGA